jgi:hypothetical protein
MSAFRGKADAACMRDYRARQKTGSIIIPVLVCETKLVAALIEARLLSPLQADDRVEVGRAVQKLIDEFQGD